MYIKCAGGGTLHKHLSVLAECVYQGHKNVSIPSVPSYDVALLQVMEFKVR